MKQAARVGKVPVPAGGGVTGGWRVQLKASDRAVKNQRASTRQSGIVGTPAMRSFVHRMRSSVNDESGATSDKWSRPE